MGKRGIERPFVVATRLTPAEMEMLERQRGSIPVATWLRMLIRWSSEGQ